jgi:hypothetical protein
MVSKQWLIVTKNDVKGAFVQMPMEGEPVHMKVDLKITRYKIKLFLDLKKYVEEDGCLYTGMLKAMYGCIQSSSLWYRLLKRILEGLRYVMSETNKCVFRKIVEGKI